VGLIGGYSLAWLVERIEPHQLQQRRILMSQVAQDPEGTASISALESYKLKVPGIWSVAVLGLRVERRLGDD
jgi:hypothetical protein